MLDLKTKDPIRDNPFRLLGLSGVALESKSLPEATALARTVAKVLRNSPHTTEYLRKKAIACLNELNDESRALEAFKAFRGLTPDAVISHLENLASQKRELVLLKEQAVWRYQLEQAAPPSLQHGVRMSPAHIKVTDVISLLRSPIRETSDISRKLFNRSLRSIGGGDVEGGIDGPLKGETRREMIGVLNLAVGRRPIQFTDVEKVLEQLGLITPPESCLQDHRPSSRSGVQKVHHARSGGPTYTHFLPMEAVERLLVVQVDDVYGGISASIPAPTPSACSILLTRVSLGSRTALCLEGVVESIQALEAPEVKPESSSSNTRRRTTGATSPRRAKMAKEPTTRKRPTKTNGPDSQN